MTTERIPAGRTTTVDGAVLGSEAAMKAGEPLRALVYELRALRLMLREEIREAAWRIAAGDADVLATPKAPDA